MMGFGRSFSGLLMEEASGTTVVIIGLSYFNLEVVVEKK